ncbi:MAG: hypothetical protein ACI9XP_000182 [Lentimonas sp.]|jgi:hypothetical protein
MSQKLENLFKKSLSSHEEPYDPKAWSKMATQLDKVMPVTSNSLLKPWMGYAAAGVIAVASIAYFTTPNKDENIKNSAPVISEQIPINTPSKPITVDETIQSTSINTDKKAANKTTTSVENKVVVSQNETHQPPVINELPKLDQANIDENNKPVVNEMPTVLLPEIESGCLNQLITIANSNKLPIKLQMPNGKSVKVLANESYKFKAEQDGMYKLSSYVSPVESQFEISNASVNHFEISEEYIYQKGIPVTKVYTHDFDKSSRWYLDGEELSNKTAQIELNIFKKGNHEIKLSSIDEKGCLSETKKTIYVERPYNLLAMEAFNPTDMDVRNTRFMPVALKERQSGFELIIINPKDGRVVFTSNDPNIGWDGIDKRTGKLGQSNSNYIWKVVLRNPTKGESPEYRGIITLSY